MSHSPSFWLLGAICTHAYMEEGTELLISVRQKTVLNYTLKACLKNPTSPTARLAPALFC